MVAADAPPCDSGRRARTMARCGQQFVDSAMPLRVPEGNIMTRLKTRKLRASQDDARPSLRLKPAANPPSGPTVGLPTRHSNIPDAYPDPFPLRIEEDSFLRTLSRRD